MTVDVENPKNEYSFSGKASPTVEAGSLRTKPRDSRQSQAKSDMSRSFEADGLARLFGIQQVQGDDSRKRNPSESIPGNPPTMDVVDWTLVLESLQERTLLCHMPLILYTQISNFVPPKFLCEQREKMLAIARKEEHYVNRSLFYFTSSSKLRLSCFQDYDVLFIKLFLGYHLCAIYVSLYPDVSCWPIKISLVAGNEQLNLLSGPHSIRSSSS